MGRKVGKRIDDGFMYSGGKGYIPFKVALSFCTQDTNAFVYFLHECECKDEASVGVRCTDGAWLFYFTPPN